MAVLTCIAIAHEDVFARESARLVGDPAVLEQADHGREADCRARRMDGIQRLILGGRHSLQDQHKGAPGTTDIDRFVAGIQNQYGFLQSIRHFK